MGSRRVRPASERDLEQIVRLEHEAFAVPWSEKSLRYELLHNDLAQLFVIVEGEEVLAYAGYHEIIDECEITNICVARRARQQGLGEQLLGALLADARQRGLVRASLEVRPSNSAALALYRKFHFKWVGLRHAYYPDNREDALILAVNLQGEARRTIL